MIQQKLNSQCQMAYMQNRSRLKAVSIGVFLANKACSGFAVTPGKMGGSCEIRKPLTQTVSSMTNIWYWKSRLPERKGQTCKILAFGKMNSILVEFQDGYKVITSRYAVRKINCNNIR